MSFVDEKIANAVYVELASRCWRNVEIKNLRGADDRAEARDNEDGPVEISSGIKNLPLVCRFSGTAA